MEIYITFGQDHKHKINGNVFDKDCVAIIEAESRDDGRLIAIEYFGDKWGCTYVDEKKMDRDVKKFFPRGYIELEVGK